VWLPKERRYLLWVPLADLCGGLRACPGNIVRDSAPGDETMSNVHTTYTRMVGVPAISSCAVLDCGCV